MEALIKDAVLLIGAQDQRMLKYVAHEDNDKHIFMYVHVLCCLVEGFSVSDLAVTPCLDFLFVF